VLDDYQGLPMASAAKNKYNKQTWLYMTSTGLSLIETGMGKNALPYFDVKATIAADNPLESPGKHVAWVKKNAPSNINILLSHALYQLLLSDVPDVPEAELDDAIELKAADLLSYDIDDAVIDVIQLPSEAYRGRMRMAFIIALRKTPIVDWMKALILQGIKTKIIDVEITQLRNLAVFHQSLNTSGLLYLQPNQSRLALTFNRELVLSRSFDIGLSSLITETTIDDGELELTVTEDTKFEIQIESLVLEIRRSFDYYEAQLGLGSIAEMQFLCDEAHESIATELANRLGVRFVIMRPQDYVEIRLGEASLDPVHFFGLTGLVYREALS